MIDCQKGIAERKSIGVIGFKIFHKAAVKNRGNRHFGPCRQSAVLGFGNGFIRVKSAVKEEKEQRQAKKEYNQKCRRLI